MDEMEKIRKEIRKEVEDSIDVNEDSDIPIREKLTKDKKIRNVRNAKS